MGAWLCAPSDNPSATWMHLTPEPLPLVWPKRSAPSWTSARPRWATRPSGRPVPPFSEALTAAVQGGATLREAWGAAATIAEQSAETTANLLPPLMGRARPHAEKSLGTPDAGAVSMAMIVRAIHNALSDENSVATTSIKETA